jgi:hypothetical protein
MLLPLDAQEVGVGRPSPGDDPAAVQGDLPAAAVRDDPSRLLHEEDARRDVPGEDIVVHEEVVAAGGGVGQAQGGAAGDSHALHSWEELVHQAQHLLAALVAIAEVDA